MQGANQFGGLDVSESERPSNPEHVLPVGTDGFWIDVVAGERIQRPVVGTAIEAPEARRAEVWGRRADQRPSVEPLSREDPRLALDAESDP